jgi:hypothetical protein
MQNSAAKKRGKERGPTPKAGRFFEAQLPGEDGLSNRTAGKLFDLANEICYRKPWKDMGGRGPGASQGSEIAGDVLLPDSGLADEQGTRRSAATSPQAKKQRGTMYGLCLVPLQDRTAQMIVLARRALAGVSTSCCSGSLDRRFVAVCGRDGVSIGARGRRV